MLGVPGRAITARRARSRKGRRSSPGSSAIGAPNVTEHRMGTGTTSPLGITRCTLLIHAGTSTTFGNICASLYRPDLKGWGSSPWPRVPSGKITIESPLSSARTSGASGSLSGSAARRASGEGGAAGSGAGSGPPGAAVSAALSSAGAALPAASAAGAGVRAGLACRSTYTALNTAVVIHCLKGVLVQ